jgi:hypothetical protein
MLFDKRVYSPWHDGSLAPLPVGRGVEKLDAILRKVDPDNADRTLAEIEKRHPQS